MIHGRPRHPQTQGLVEQANGTMERMIAAMITQFKSNVCVDYLPKMMFNLNTQFFIFFSILLINQLIIVLKIH